MIRAAAALEKGGAGTGLADPNWPYLYAEYMMRERTNIGE